MALAHAALTNSTPAKGSTLQSSPPNLVLVFEEAVQLKALTVQKVGDKAPTAISPLPAAASEQLSVPLPKLGDGDYVITYTYVGDDTHVMKGTIAFKISAHGG
jgi:methionine-rich copper-binding protein CopC